jgi:hypothetical protein
LKENLKENLKGELEGEFEDASLGRLQEQPEVDLQGIHQGGNKASGSRSSRVPSMTNLKRQKRPSRGSPKGTTKELQVVNKGN